MQTRTPGLAQLHVFLLGLLNHAAVSQTCLAEQLVSITTDFVTRVYRHALAATTPESKSKHARAQSTSAVGLIRQLEHIRACHHTRISMPHWSTCRTCRSSRPCRSCSGSGCAGHVEAGSGAASPKSFPPRRPRRPSPAPSTITPAPSTITTHPPACAARAPPRRRNREHKQSTGEAQSATARVRLRGAGLGVALVLQKTSIQGLEPKLQALQEFHLVALKHLGGRRGVAPIPPHGYRPFLTTPSTSSTCAMTFGVASSMATRLALREKRLTFPLSIVSGS